MAHLKLIIAIIGLIMQLLKRMDNTDDEGESHIIVKIDKMIKFKAALKAADEGKAKPLEEMFAIIRPDDAVD